MAARRAPRARGSTRRGASRSLRPLNTLACAAGQRAAPCCAPGPYPERHAVEAPPGAAQAGAGNPNAELCCWAARRPTPRARALPRAPRGRGATRRGAGRSRKP